MQELSSELIDRRERQKCTLLYSAHCVSADIRCSAGFVKLLIGRVGKRCLTNSLFSGLCRGIDLVTVVILGDGLHRLAYLCVHDKFHRHAALLTVDILLAHTGKKLLSDPVIVGLHAEHVLFVAVKVALREAVAGKCIGEHGKLVRCRLTLFLYDLRINARHEARILGALHAAFYLHAGDTCVLNFLKSLDKAVILERKRVAVGHSAGHGVLHAAGLGAHAAVAAAAADERGHVALSRVAEAQRAVDEYLRLDARMLCDKLYLLKRQLTREHSACQPHLGRGLDACKIVYAHLGAGVQRDIRHGASEHR